MKNLPYKELAIAYAVMITIGSSIPGTLMTNDEIFAFDKVMHLTEYFGFGVIVGLTFIFSDNRRHSMKWLAYTVRIGLVYSLFDEAYQSLIPGREPSFLDVVADLGGILTAIVVLSFAYYKIDPSRTERQESAE